MTPPRRLTAADAAPAAALLARAMTDDPGWIHIIPDDATRTARMTRLFELVLARHFARLGASCVVDGVGGAPAAAAVWAPPGAHAPPTLTAIGLAPRLGWLVRGRITAALRMFRAMERRAPKEPHHYLAILGVDPQHQGRGLGAALLAPAFDACDAARTIAWLESTNPRNHAFYRRVGFAVADELPIAGGPTITWFARQPR